MTDEQLAYETHEDRGYRIKAYYLNDGSNHARIEMWKGDVRIWETRCEAYRIYNYSAHLSDMVEDELHGVAGGAELAAKLPEPTPPTETRWCITCEKWMPIKHDHPAPTERVETMTNYAGIACNSFISGDPFPQFCKNCGLAESAHRVSPEKLAIIIRDWFLSSGCHYAGWGEFEADIDGTFKFDELAKAILSQAAVAPSPAPTIKWTYGTNYSVPPNEPRDISRERLWNVWTKNLEPVVKGVTLAEAERICNLHNEVPSPAGESQELIQETITVLKRAARFIAKVDDLHQTIYSYALDEECEEIIKKLEAK